MRSRLGILLGCTLLGSAIMLSACGKKSSGGDMTNIVEMNPNDGTINDLSAVESTTIDQAGANDAGNEAMATDNMSNGM